MKAAQASNPTACRLVGVKYYKGTGIEKNYEESFKWLTKAALSGDSRCENSLGYSYQNGVGTKQDFHKSLRLFRSSAKKGNIAGTNSLGYSYEKGLGVALSARKSLKYYQLSGIGENSQAQYNVGYSYKSNGFDWKNQEIAFKWYLKAHKNHFLDATNSLAICYEEGLGTKINLEKSVDLYLQAATESEYAQYNLGVNYCNGTGVDVNYSKAYDWFEKSSNNGHLPSKGYINKLQKIHFILSFNPKLSEIKDIIKSEPNLKDKGDTPLHYLANYCTCRQDLREKIIFFLDNGADYRIKDNNKDIFELVNSNNKTLSKWMKSYCTIINDFLKLFERGELTDCEIKGYKLHKKWIEYRLNNEISNIKIILEKYTKKELLIFFEWLYSGIIGNVSTIESICKYFNIGNIWDFSGRRGLIKILTQFNRNKKTKDFSICVKKNKNIKVHKLVLLARSDLYRGMFINISKPIYRVKDYSGKCIQSINLLVDFLYTDNIDTSKLSQQVKEELFDAIDYYQLNEKSMLRHHLNSSNQQNINKKKKKNLKKPQKKKKMK
ncbi:sel1-repeat-containing protein ybeq [Anaeramoeba flamelloides]|uniref:Sel1-repeat-containing protein ybeq n=1 Tax=Anaeramoeba flamelloides TaxID=1746091 RepID=A0ABQ8X469_9EUKA|nr:sel1-repeat-containing protein ybeq [Anaeramoeba flamelloides]